MIVDREVIMAALFARLSGAQLRASAGGGPAFKGKKRNWTTIAQVTEAERPCLLMLEDDENLMRPRAGMPPGRLTIKVQALVYLWTAGLAIPAKSLNNVLDAVSDVLDPGPGLGIRALTLNGLTYDAWIAGHIIKVPGYRDGQGLLVVPIQVLGP